MNNALNEDGLLSEAILNGEPFVANGIEFDNRLGLGAVPDVANIGYMGLVGTIKPSVFLELVPPLAGYRKTIDHLASYPSALGMPFLDISFTEEGVPPLIKGHEGRSRMTYLKEHVSDQPFPVALFFFEHNYSLRHHKIEPWMVEALQRSVNSQKCSERPSRLVEGPFFEQIIYLDAFKRVARPNPDLSQALTP